MRKFYAFILLFSTFALTGCDLFTADDESIKKTTNEICLENANDDLCKSLEITELSNEKITEIFNVIRLNEENDLCLGYFASTNNDLYNSCDNNFDTFFPDDISNFDISEVYLEDTINNEVFYKIILLDVTSNYSYEYTISFINLNGLYLVNSWNYNSSQVKTTLTPTSYNDINDQTVTDMRNFITLLNTDFDDAIDEYFGDSAEKLKVELSNKNDFYYVQISYGYNRYRLLYSYEDENGYSSDEFEFVVKESTYEAINLNDSVFFAEKLMLSILKDRGNSENLLNNYVLNNDDTESIEFINTLIDDNLTLVKSNYDELDTFVVLKNSTNNKYYLLDYTVIQDDQVEKIEVYSFSEIELTTIEDLTNELVSSTVDFPDSSISNSDYCENYGYLYPNCEGFRTYAMDNDLTLVYSTTNNYENELHYLQFLESSNDTFEAVISAQVFAYNLPDSSTIINRFIFTTSQFYFNESPKISPEQVFVPFLRDASNPNISSVTLQLKYHSMRDSSIMENKEFFANSDFTDFEILESFNIVESETEITTFFQVQYNYSNTYKDYSVISEYQVTFHYSGNSITESKITGSVPGLSYDKIDAFLEKFVTAMNSDTPASVIFEEDMLNEITLATMYNYLKNNDAYLEVNSIDENIVHFNIVNEDNVTINDVYLTIANAFDSSGISSLYLTDIYDSETLDEVELYYRSIFNNYSSRVRSEDLTLSEFCVEANCSTLDLSEYEGYTFGEIGTEVVLNDNLKTVLIISVPISNLENSITLFFEAPVEPKIPTNQSFEFKAIHEVYYDNIPNVDLETATEFVNDFLEDLNNPELSNDYFCETYLDSNYSSAICTQRALTTHEIISISMISLTPVYDNDTIVYYDLIGLYSTIFHHTPIETTMTLCVYRNSTGNLVIYLE